MAFARLIDCCTDQPVGDELGIDMAGHVADRLAVGQVRIKPGLDAVVTKNKRHPRSWMASVTPRAGSVMIAQPSDLSGLAPDLKKNEWAPPAISQATREDPQKALASNAMTKRRTKPRREVRDQLSRWLWVFR